MKKITHNIQSILRKTPRSLLITLSTLGMCQVSQAALMVSVTGDANGKGSTWVFNGTSDVRLTQEIKADDSSTAINQWSHKIGDLLGEYASDANYDNFRATGVVSGGSVMGSSSGAIVFTDLLLDSDGTAGSDDFAWLIGSGAPHTFDVGETITYSNYTLKTNLDITTFGEGVNPIVNNGDTLTVSSTGEPIGGLTMTFTATSAPEPSSTLLLGMSTLGFLARRKRS